MIPKVIHYCWFGGNPLPADAEKYIDSWKKHCPDYQIIEWNEKNFDVNQLAYTKEAYDAGKWAFITDYVRLYALYNQGGIYMDTDVEVIKNLDEFLTEKGFSGFEREDCVPTGIMAAEKGNKFIYKLLSEYDNLHFLQADGSLDMTTNVKRITRSALAEGLVLNNKKQRLENFTFYPTEYFCPKNCRTMEINLTDSTYTIHHFSGSWNGKNKYRKVLKQVFPPAVLKVLVKCMDLLHIK